MEKHNFLIVNTDTDSISFCKPDGSEITSIERKTLIEEINKISPEHMIWGDDGLYQRLICLAAKNYIMKDEKGKVKLKGSSLKDAKLEPMVKQMVREFIDSLLENRNNFLDIYLKYVKMVNNVTDIKLWASKKTLSATTFKSKRENEAKIIRAIKDTDYREGDKIYTFYLSSVKVKLPADYGDEHFGPRYGFIKELCLVEKFDGIYDKDALYLKLFKNIQKFGVVMDISGFLNYTLKKNKKALEELNV